MKENWFWWYMLVCNCIIPMLMIVLGRWMWKHYPKKINGLMGYRTKRSMKNEETWRFGNQYCGQLWYKLGLIMVVPSILILVPFRASTDNTIGIVSLVLNVIQLLVLVGCIIPTEKALKKQFPDF
ncbi:MAG: SdpI family protein [Lachnospiraceae bacterium]|nr:SdpI family protein [Lachnospiraceae bacterium]